LCVADRDTQALAAFGDAVRTRALDVGDPAALRDALAGADVVINALPYFLSLPIARAAREQHVHYFDLTEDVNTAHEVRRIAEGAETVFAPQCGLAPGFISIA